LLKLRPEKLPDNSGFLGKIKTLESLNYNLKQELDDVKEFL